MTGKNKGLTRRDFLRGAAGATLAGSMAGAAETQDRAKVVLVRDEKAIDAQGKPDADVLQRMLDEAVAALMDKDSPMAAWKTLVKPEDTVGIKTNEWRNLRTPPELEQAVKRRLMDVGVREDRVAVADRGALTLEAFRNATALINMRPMRTHHWAGVGSLIKNYIMFSEKPPSWHGDSCANLAGIWNLPIVKGKTRLNILVMLTPLFHGKGPHNFSPNYLWPYRGLIVGTDPVAVDSTGLHVIQAKRKAHFGRDEPLPVSPRHIRVAQDKFGLGIADPDRIDVLKLGWQEDMVI